MLKRSFGTKPFFVARLLRPNIGGRIPLNDLSCSFDTLHFDNELFSSAWAKSTLAQEGYSKLVFFFAARPAQCKRRPQPHTTPHNPTLVIRIVRMTRALQAMHPKHKRGSWQVLCDT